MIQIVFAMQQEGAHEAVVSKIPGPLDDIAFGESVADVLSRRPIEGEASVEHQCVLPAKIQQPKQRGEKCDYKQRFQPHRPNSHVLYSVEEVPSRFESPENSVSHGERRNGENDGAQRH